MRPCIEALVGLGSWGSHSLAELAVANERSGVRCFRCETLMAEGFCLFERCNIFLSRRGGPAGGGGVGVRGREPPVVSSGGAASPHLISLAPVGVDCHPDDGVPDYHKGVRLPKRVRRARREFNDRCMK